MKKFSIMLILLTIVGIGFYKSNRFKESIINQDINDIINNASALDMNIDILYETKSKPESVYKLVENSEAVLVAELIDDSRIGFETEQLSKVRVKEVLKGEDIDNEIYVYEDIGIYASWYGYPQPPQNGEIFYSGKISTGSNLMETGQQYILFLDKLDKSSLDKNTQTFKISEDKWGIYNIKRNNIEIVSENNEDITYKDIKQIDLFVSTEEEKKQYVDFRKEVIKYIDKNTK